MAGVNKATPMREQMITSTAVRIICTTGTVETEWKMSSDEYKPYYNFIIDVIHSAGQILNEEYKSLRRSTGKRPDDNVVTHIYGKIMKLLTDEIRNRYPDHVIMGDTSDEKLTDHYTWIVRPIDGKRNFIDLMPIVAISVALVVNKNAVVGIVFNPIMNEFYSAVKYGGAYCNGNKISSYQHEEFHDSMVGIEFPLVTNPFFQEKTINRISKLSQHKVVSFRSYGSVALSLCYLACRRLNIYITDVTHCSETAAGVLILQEAGGSVYSLNDNDIKLPLGMLYAAGNKNLLKKVMTVLGETS